MNTDSLKESFLRINHKRVQTDDRRSPQEPFQNVTRKESREPLKTPTDVEMEAINENKNPSYMSIYL